MRLLVPVEPDMAYLGHRHEIHQALHHAEPGAEYGHHRELAAGDPFGVHRAYRRLYHHILERDVTRDLVAH